MNETKKRSIAKAVSWRMVALVAGSITTYAVLKDIRVAIEVMIWANIVSTIVYYIHERVWNKITCGRTNNYVE